MLIGDWDNASVTTETYNQNGNQLLKCSGERPMIPYSHFAEGLPADMACIMHPSIVTLSEQGYQEDSDLPYFSMPDILDQ